MSDTTSSAGRDRPGASWPTVASDLLCTYSERLIEEVTHMACRLVEVGTLLPVWDDSICRDSTRAAYPRFLRDG